MTMIVLDTNVLVSAFWSAQGPPRQILKAVLNRELLPCHDYRIMREYAAVLRRPKFNFPDFAVAELLAEIGKSGLSVVAPASTDPLPDESDRPFYDVARCCRAMLITGNLKHYPRASFIVSPTDFLLEWEQK